MNIASLNICRVINYRSKLFRSLTDLTLTVYIQIKMKICERTFSSFREWYPLFQQFTFKSVTVNIPEEVLAYINEDGIILPVEAVSCRQPTDSFCDDSSDDDDCNLLNRSEEDPNSKEKESAVEQPSFPEFSQKIQDAIDAMGGNVFIKAIWSAPTDASWIIPGRNLKCSSIEDVYLLLNSSSRLQNDFSSLKGEQTHYIVFKKWEDIHPSSEFRCFVHNRSLIGISQRDCSDMHNYIRDAKMEIIKDIVEFFVKHMKEHCPLANYTFDILRLSNSKIILVDIGVFDKKFTKSYLFSWEELMEIGNSHCEIDEPEFRYIATTTGVQPSEAFTGFCMPYDLQNISSSKQVIDLIVDSIETEIKKQNYEE